MKSIRFSLTTFSDLLSTSESQAFYNLLESLIDKGYTIQPYKDDLEEESRPISDIQHLNNLIKMLEGDNSLNT